MTQILLTKQLVVNLGNDTNGEPKTVTLPAGLQEVDAEIAGHWFVKAHAQEITPSIAINQELQDNFDQLKTDHEALQTQSNEATKKIVELEKQAKADAKTIADLQKQIAESAKADTEVKPDPKAK